MTPLREEKAVGSSHYRNTMKLTYKSPFDGQEDWALAEPGQGGTWVIVLHGHGSTGTQIFTRTDIAEMWLPLMREKGLGILSPNLRGNAWMCQAAIADLRHLLAIVKKKYPVRRFILASGSMGGTGALIYAVRHPEDIAGVCALCPATDIGRYHGFAKENGPRIAVLAEIAAAIENAYGGTPATAPASYAANSATAHAARLAMPVYLCHGNADVIIPVEESRTLASELKKLGRKCEYVELKNGHHDSPIPECLPGIDWVLRNVGE